MINWFRWGGLPTTEATIDAKSIQVRLFGEKARMLDQQVAQVGKSQ